MKTLYKATSKSQHLKNIHLKNTTNALRERQTPNLTNIK